MLVIVNNFNRLTTTKALCEYLDMVPGAAVQILDNGSTYPPLLDWYTDCGRDVVFLGKNLGHLAPWLTENHDGEPYYVVTDSDLDMSQCPVDVLEVLRRALERFPTRVKVGVGLELSDLPKTRLAELVMAEQAKYWRHRVLGNPEVQEPFFMAPVETTFACYRRGRRFASGPALRTDRPYVARHVPWYGIPGQLDDEEQYYMATARRDISTTKRWSGL